MILELSEYGKNEGSLYREVQNMEKGAVNSPILHKKVIRVGMVCILLPRCQTRGVQSHRPT